MFKLNGTEYSLEEVTSAAEASNLSVDEYVNEFGLETVEVTDEIQTEPKGKTSDVATVDAAVTSEPDTASESTELEPDDILSGLEEIKDVREIDKRIDKITSTKATEFFEAGEISPLDSPKRIAQYKKLINRRNNIIGDTYKLGQTQQYQQLDFDPMSPAKIPLEKEGAPEGGVKLAYVPFTVDGEVVGTTMEPVGLKEVVITAEQYKERENQIKEENFFYNTKTREIVWELPKLVANTGINSPVKEVVFQIGIKPEKTDVGKIMKIMDEVKAVGYDEFVNEEIITFESELTTKLPDDDSIGTEEGIVIEGASSEE